MTLLYVNGWDVLSFAYAFLVAIGGGLGYIKAGSTASLSAGLIFGVVMAFAAYQMSLNAANFYLGLACSGFMLFFMGGRYVESQKLMPAGLVSLLSAVLFVRFALRIFDIYLF